MSLCRFALSSPKVHLISIYGFAHTGSYLRNTSRAPPPIVTQAAPEITAEQTLPAAPLMSCQSARHEAQVGRKSSSL